MTATTPTQSCYTPLRVVTEPPAMAAAKGSLSCVDPASAVSLSRSNQIRLCAVLPRSGRGLARKRGLGRNEQHRNLLSRKYAALGFHGVKLANGMESPRLVQ